MKRQEKTANKRENKDPGHLADAKSQAEVAESQPVCSGEQTIKNNNNNNPTTNPPTHPPTNSTPSSLRSPGEVNPRFTVTVSRPGAGENATGQILRALLYAPEDYSVGRITQVTDATG